MKIETNFLKSTIWFVLALIVITLFSAVTQYYETGNWWNSNYWLSLLIPISLMTFLVTVIFTPKYISISTEAIEIKYLLRKEKIIPLKFLKAYGWGKNVYVLYLKNRTNPIQFSISGFPKKEWLQFEELLSEFSDAEKAIGFNGTKPILKKK